MNKIKYFLVILVLFAFSFVVGCKNNKTKEPTKTKVETKEPKETKIETKSVAPTETKDPEINLEYLNSKLQTINDDYKSYKYEEEIKIQNVLLLNKVIEVSKTDTDINIKTSLHKLADLANTNVYEDTNNVEKVSLDTKLIDLFIDNKYLTSNNTFKNEDDLNCIEVVFNETGCNEYFEINVKEIKIVFVFNKAFMIKGYTCTYSDSAENVSFEVELTY